MGVRCGIVGVVLACLGRERMRALWGELTLQAVEMGGCMGGHGWRGGGWIMMEGGWMDHDVTSYVVAEE